MGLFGKILGTALDVATSPLAVVQDVIPGAGGYVDGERSKTAQRIEDVADDLHDVREEVEEL